MTREEVIWWVNHLFEIRKEEYFNKGMMKDAKEVETAQNMAIEALSAEAETEKETDGCFGCRYESLGALDLPCVECRNNYLSKYERKRSDLISRADLFNALATVNAPMEANEYKAEVYKIINEMKGE